MNRLESSRRQTRDNVFIFQNEKKKIAGDVRFTHLTCSYLRQKGVRNWYSKYKPEYKKNNRKTKLRTNVTCKQYIYLYTPSPNTSVNGIFVFMLISWLTRSFLMTEYNVYQRMCESFVNLIPLRWQMLYASLEKRQYCRKLSSANAIDRISCMFHFSMHLSNRLSKNSLLNEHIIVDENKRTTVTFFFNNNTANSIVQHLNIHFGVK